MFKAIMQLLSLIEGLVVAFKKAKKKREEAKLNEEMAKRDDNLTIDNLRDLLK